MSVMYIKIFNRKVCKKGNFTIWFSFPPDHFQMEAFLNLMSLLSNINIPLRNYDQSYRKKSAVRDLQLPTTKPNFIPK